MSSTTQQLPQQYPAPEPKKKHTVRNIILAVLLLMLLALGGYMAMLVGGLNAADENRNDRPMLVKEGQPFTHGQYAVKAGWKVADDFGGDPTIKHLVVTSHAHSRAMAVLMFRLYKGKHDVGRIVCSSAEMRFGETSSQVRIKTWPPSPAMDCSSSGAPWWHRWTSVKAETWAQP